MTLYVIKSPAWKDRKGNTYPYGSKAEMPSAVAEWYGFPEYVAPEAPAVEVKAEAKVEVKAPEPEAAEEDLESLGLKELKELAATRGVEVKGRGKASFVAALKA